MMEEEGADVCFFRNTLSSRAFCLLRAVRSFHFDFFPFLKSAHFGDSKYSSTTVTMKRIG